MEVGLPALRAFVLNDDDLARVCAAVLTVLAHDEMLFETLNFNELDVTIDRSAGLVTFEDILSVDGRVVQLSEHRFVEVASAIARPLDGKPLEEWQKRRARRVRPMPPASH